VIQPSEWRSFKDEEYVKAGVCLKEDVSDCDILIGIKEVSKAGFNSREKNMYSFRTRLKRQPHNRELLQTIVKKKNHAH